MMGARAPGPRPSSPRLSAGVITADLTRLGAELEHLRGQAAWAHVDVMDGVFCPQLTVRPAFVAAVASTGIPVDVHLMVEEPRRLLPEIASWGIDVIVSGSAIFDRVDPAGNLDLLSAQLRTPEEVSDGQR